MGPKSGVRPQIGATDNMHVAVGLALHSVMSKVRKNPKSSRRIHHAHVDRQVTHTGHEITAPQLDLAHVFARHHQQHQGDPRELVNDDHQVVV